MSRAPASNTPRAVALWSALLVAALSFPGSAAAAPFTCEASALRGSVASAPPVEPVTANRGASLCRSQTAGANTPTGLPVGLTVSAAFARTTATGAESQPALQRAGATGGLGAVRVPLVPGLPGLPPLPDVPPVSVPGFGTIDVRPLLAALAAPQGDLLSLGAVSASASGQCQGGQAQLTGSSSVAALSVLGVELPTDRATSRTIGIDSCSIDPSTLDVTPVAPPGVDLALFKAAIQPVLDALPTIVLPAAAAQVSITPAEQIRTSDRLTQRALTARISIAGQSVIDMVFGEAIVGATAVPCGQAVAAQALRCGTRRLVLIDVVPSGRRVRFVGAASARLAGRRVSIVFTDSGRTVARARVDSDGLFRATAPLPPAALRHTNRARYQARLGRERSLRLKLVRRLQVTGITARGRGVVVSGRISRPLARPLQTVVVTRRVSCGRVEVVKRFKPSRSGRFRVALPAAKRRQVAVFRFRTLVRFDGSDPKLYRTFTLPRFVDIG